MAEKRAIQRVVRDSNGGLKTVYIDLETLLEIPSTALDQYRIVNTTPPPPEPVKDVNSPNEGEEEPPTSPNDKSDREGERPDNKRSIAERITQRENPQGAPVGKVTRGTLGPATPSTDISRNPQDTQRSPEVSKNTPSIGTGTGSVKMENTNKAGRFRDIDPGLKSFMSDVASSVVPGASVHVFSGDINPEDPGWSANNSALSKSHRHTDQMGADVYFSDATGKRITDPVAVNDIAMALAAADPLTGIGIGPGYMSPNTMHIDLSGLGGSWGAKGKKANMDPVVSGNIDFARESRMGPGPYADAPTPYGPDSTQAFISQDERVIDRPNRPETFISQDERPGSTGNVANAVTKDTVTRGFGIGNLTPDSTAYNGNYFGPDRVNNNDAIPSRFGYDPNPDRFGGTVQSSGLGTPEDQAIQSITSRSPLQDKVAAVSVPTSYDTPAMAAAFGAFTRTPAEINAINMTIAGELGADTLKALAAGDPLAKTEFANMLTSIENRAQSKMYTGIADTLTPTQYNSLARENLPTTMDNLERYGPVLDSLSQEYYSGGLIPTSWGITSYYNPSLVTPAWASQMEDPTMVTEHLFGTLPEYGPSTAFRSSNALMSNPRPDNSIGVNYSPPSESGGSRFGGTGLGGNGRGIANSVGGMSSIDNSPDDRDSRGERSSGSGGYSGNSGSQDSPSESGGRFGGGGLGGNTSSGSYSGKGGQDSPSESGGRFGGGGLGSSSKSQSAHDAERERDNSL